MNIDYRILILNIKSKLREGKIIEAYEKLQDLEELNYKHIKELEKGR